LKKETGIKFVILFKRSQKSAYSGERGAYQRVLSL